MKNAEELPDDITELILLDLPYKSLVRFKSVSMQWQHIISQPSFIYRRYNTNNNNNTTYGNSSSSSSFIVARSRLGPEKTRYLTHLSVSYTDDGDKLTTTDVENFTIPSIIGSPLHAWLIYSAGFGVYALFDLRQRKVCLWNPTIREVKVLPTLPCDFSKHEDNDRYVYGFAHVEFSNNNFSYKVGMMRDMYDEIDEMYCLNIDVYSSLDNIWRPSKYSRRLSRSGDLYSGNGWTFVGTILNGKFHFLNWFSEEDVHIITFDIFTEVFERLEIPSSLPLDANAASSILTSVDGQFLCLVIYRGDYDDPQSGDVWIMSEYGKAESWTKVSTAGPVRDPEFVDILAINNHVGGMFFQSMEYGDGLFFCRYGSEKVETVLPVRSQDLEMFVMVQYGESLVSFDGTSDQRIKFLSK